MGSEGFLATSMAGLLEDTRNVSNDGRNLSNYSQLFRAERETPGKWKTQFFEKRRKVLSTYYSNGSVLEWKQKMHKEETHSFSEKNMRNTRFWHVHYRRPFGSRLIFIGKLFGIRANEHTWTMSTQPITHVANYLGEMPEHHFGPRPSSENKTRNQFQSCTSVVQMTDSYSIHTPPWEIVIRTSSVTGCFEVREEHKNCRDGTSFVISTGFGTFLIDWYKMRQRMRSQEHTNAASKNTWKIGWSSFCVENIDSQHLSRERQTDKTTPGRFSNNNTTQQQSCNFEKVYLMR